MLFSSLVGRMSFSEIGKYRVILLNSFIHSFIVYYIFCMLLTCANVERNIFIKNYLNMFQYVPMIPEILVQDCFLVLINYIVFVTVLTMFYFITTV